MSTKIYNAYKYDGNLYELFNELKRVKNEYQDEKIEFFSKLDNLKIPIDKGKEISLKDIENELLGEIYLSNFLEDRIKKGYNEPINIQASIVVYPYNDDLYVQFFGVNDKLIKTINGLHDYHYQNSTDISNYDWEKEEWGEMTVERQKELEDDWDERRKIWDEILGYNTPSDSGFIFDLNPSGYNLTMFCSRITEKIKNKNNKNE